MKHFRGTALLFSLLFSLTLAPMAFASPPPDAWADAVYNYSGTGVDNPNNALGSPDNQTTNNVGVQKFITLDMGENEEGTGSLRVYFGQLLLQTGVQVTFLDSALNQIKSETHNLSVSTSSHSELFTYNYADFNKPYRYVRLTSTAEIGFSLDAVEALSYNTVTPPPPTPPTPPASCTSDSWSCEEWSFCSANGRETRTCTMVQDCPGVTSQSPVLSRECIPPSSTPTPSPTPSQPNNSYNYYYIQNPGAAPTPTPTPTPTPGTPRPPTGSGSTKTSSDTTAPTISNIQTIALDPTTEKVIWSTDELSDSGMEYGPEGGVQRFTPLDPTLTKDHAVWLSELKPNTVYTFRVFSRDAAGNQAVSPEERFTSGASDTLDAGMVLNQILHMMGWCGWLILLLLTLFAIATGSAIYWRHEAIRSKKSSRKS